MSLRRVLRVEILRSAGLALRAAAVLDIRVTGSQLVDISVLDFLNATASVQLFANQFIGLYELVYLSGKLVILSADYSDMIIHRVYFILHGSIVIMESLV